MSRLHRTARQVLAALIVASTVLAGIPAIAADPVSDGQWYTSFLKLDEAHKISKGAGVTVAVIDTGVDATHPDLVGSVLPGADFSSPAQSSGNGQTDTHGHGTAMASLIVGHGQIRGVAPEAKILPLRAASGVVIGIKNLPASIEWAVAHGAKVISISLVDHDDDLTTKSIINAALAKDVVIVAAAGNKPEDTQVTYPAAYPGVIAVGGIDKTGSQSPKAVSGPEIVVVAPADGISVAFKDHQRAIGDGTSDSAALVAGVVALLRSRYPNLSAKDIVNRLTTTAIDKGATGRDPQFGFGIVDPVAALTANVAPLPAGSSPTTGFTTGPPIAAPGSEFPTGLAIGGGLVLLVIAVLVVVLMTRKRRSSGGGL